ENQRKDETGRILAARRFQARPTGSMRGQRVVKVKPPGPSSQEGPGGVSFNGSEDLATRSGDDLLARKQAQGQRSDHVRIAVLVGSVAVAILAERQIDHA